MKYKCLSIAGFDGSGGAGIHADIKTFSAIGCYGMSVLTSVPVQNTCGVRKCYDLPLLCIEEQLEAIFDDIRPDSIKIGMLFSAEIIELVASFLSARAKNIPIVLDPVMIAKSGDVLLMDDAVDALRVSLIPIATIITPNIPESHVLCGKNNEVELSASTLLELGCNAVLLKGGHKNSSYSSDLFLDKSGFSKTLTAKRITSKNTHGTGCTLSAAICAFLARGVQLFKACELAKQYLSGAILASANQEIGRGWGPVHHFYKLWNKVDFEEE